MLVEDEHDGDGLLLVVVADNDGLVVVGNAVVDTLGGINGCGNVGKDFLQSLLGAVNVQVAHNDDALQVGTIPLLIISTQRLGFEIVHHFHGSDGQTVARTTVGHEAGHLALEDAHQRSAAIAPFLVDDAALLVNFLGLQQEVVTPVVEDEHYRVDGGLALSGHVVNIVDCLIDRRIGV